MLVNGKEMRSLWYEDERLKLIDQRKLPEKFEIFEAKSVEDVAYAIKEMVVRGAPAIGCAAVYGVAMAEDLERAGKMLKETRPTAHDLFYAIDTIMEKIKNGEDALECAERYTEEIVEKCRKIGENGAKIIPRNARILTHCNAGALACVDYGTALAPIRIAKEKNLFVWVDETRPRLQGLLTAWELEQEDIEHAIIADNSAGYLMYNGEVDLVIVGADRIARNYDFANKIGTYEKAVVAKENEIPFYVAAPLSTFDKNIENGNQIKIEERREEEIFSIYPWKPKKAKNPAFDITPAKYVTGIITEEGIIELKN
ncbi:MAG TPA: S-methyl-5-thioribose-1-phosphate isomerase [Thermoplasmatales archaeon]|nr:S-methyl-5-thioribose-1-phosphate isomerase [Thermoplasmatales archaeon]